jgi:hypothetical protein
VAVRRIATFGFQRSARARLQEGVRSANDAIGTRLRFLMIGMARSVRPAISIGAINRRRRMLSGISNRAATRRAKVMR